MAALGWVPLPAPALTLSALPPDRAVRALKGVQGVLLTSRAAARALPCLTLPVLAVGAATAAEAAARGATGVAAAAGDASALLAAARDRFDPAAGPLLLAVGRGYGTELATGLRAAGFHVRRRVVYVAAPATALPAPARAALAAGSVVAALFFSPRSARCAIAMIEAAGLGHATQGVAALAISPRVAAAVRNGGPRWREVAVAARPEEAMLLALLGTTTATPGPGRPPHARCNRIDQR